ncbi:TRAP transporter substrate-binding protein DctP [Pusillimonas sp. ANT_WB101]|uniref:TRAP transporter substrate-binding protein DctP n=1 Tax=Pusillimonas sp. ANT_WB101 TaxID=2597356 RepID=UPI00165E448E|nr:TRAP transporter substrate-binding protein DctP [Pusillimonas sp. ANT_WB101]
MSINYLYPSDITSNEQAAALTHFKILVESATNKDIEVKLFSNLQLGSEVETTKQLKDGALVQSTLISSGAMSSFYKPYQITSTPFLFTDYATAWDFYDSKWFAEFMHPLIKERGIRYLGTFDDGGGFVAFTNNKHIIKTQADFKGLNIRVEQNPAAVEIVKSLGANATPLSWGEVQTSLATNLVDGQYNAPGTNAAFKLWDVTKYTTLAGLVYNTTTWLVSEKWFASLPENYQRIVVHAARESVFLGHGVAARVSLSGWQESCKHFTECYILPAEERAKWKAIALPAYKEWIVKSFGIAETEVDSFWAAVAKASKDVDQRDSIFLQ